MTSAVARAALLAFLTLAWAAPAHAQETIEYYGADHLGSVRVVFDAAGTVLSRADYLPFGEEVFAPTGPMPAERFTGQARDGEAGQDYFHARMYQPRTGRFNAVDPVYAGLFDPQQWNRYAYARNNPLAFTDPSGMEICEQAKGAKWCPPNQGAPNPYDVERSSPGAVGWQYAGPRPSDLTQAAEGWAYTMAEQFAKWVDVHLAESPGRWERPLVPMFSYSTAFDLENDDKSRTRLGTTVEVSDCTGRCAAIRKMFGNEQFLEVKMGMMPLVPSGQISLLHRSSTLNTSTLNHFRAQSTESIVNSLAPNSAQPLVTNAAGTVMEGNHRISVLIERGYDVTQLPRYIWTRLGF